MKRTAITIAVLALVVGCHRQPQDHAQSKAQQNQPSLAESSGPMKANDIDAITAEVRKRGEADRHKAPSVPKAAAPETHP